MPQTVKTLPKEELLAGIADQPETEKHAEQQASLLAAIVQSSDDAIIGNTLDGIIISWNKSSERLYGYTAEEAIGKPASLIIPQDRADELMDFNLKLQKNEPVINFETKRLKKDGTLFDVSISLSPILDVFGKVIGTAATARSITESKQAALYARSVIEAGLDPMITISPEGKITDVNEAKVRITGVPREKLIGSDFASYFTDPEEAREGYQQVFKEGFIREYPLVIRGASGKLTDVLFNASVYKDDKGNVFGAIAALRDVTESNKVLFYARSVIEAGLDPMITISPKGKITDVNEATVHITGVPREKLIGSDFASYFTDSEEAREGYQQVFKEGFIREYPLIIHSASGKLTDVLFNASVYKDDKNNVFGAIAAVRDITTQKKMDEKLHETSAYARSLIEASLDPLFIISPGGKITGVNHATEGVTGITREWLIDTDFSTYFTEPHKAQASYRKVLKEGLVRDFPLSIHNPSGTITDVSFNASVYKDAVGLVRGIFAVARDVTDTKKIMFYARSVIEAGLDPMITISPEGKITDVNEAKVRITGVPREKLIGSDFASYFIDPIKAREGYQQVFKEGFIREYPLVIRGASGKLTDVLFNASVYKDDKDNVFGAIATVRDVTLAKKVASELAVANKGKEEFMFRTIHDLRSPATAIRYIMEIYNEKKIAEKYPELKENFEMIVEANTRINVLLENLMKVASGKEAALSLKIVPVDISQILKKILKELAPVAKEKSVALRYSPLQGVTSTILGDVNSLKEVFSNLVDNAIKYNTKDGAVTLSCEQDDKMLKITVHNTGKTISPEDQLKLFKAYSRVDVKSEVGGTGLGLYIVKNLIEKMGGTVEVSSKPGEGTAFIISLPTAHA